MKDNRSVRVCDMANCGRPNCTNRRHRRRWVPMWTIELARRGCPSYGFASAARQTVFQLGGKQALDVFVASERV